MCPGFQSDSFSKLISKSLVNPFHCPEGAASHTGAAGDFVSDFFESAPWSASNNNKDFRLCTFGNTLA